MSAYRIMVKAREWAGRSASGWVPAISGTLNQTGKSDEEASTFDTYAEALDVADTLVDPELRGERDAEWAISDLAEEGKSAAWLRGNRDFGEDRQLAYLTAGGRLVWGTDDDMGLSHEDRETWGREYAAGWQHAARIS